MTDTNVRTVSVAGNRFAVYDRGQGKPILFVHGFPLDHRMWIAQLAALPPGWRAIAPDLRGFGASGVTSGTVSMRQMADDLAALLDALGVDQPIVYCGLSMGGYVAWPFWKQHGRRARALVLCDTRAAADSPEAAQGRKKMSEHVLRAGTSIVADAMLPKLFAPASLERLPEPVERIRETILATDPQGIVAALAGMAARPDFTGELPNIRVPTLVVVGEHDSISTVDEMRTIAHAIPGAQLEIIPEVGHMAPVESPTAFNAVLVRFLERVG